MQQEEPNKYVKELTQEKYNTVLRPTCTQTSSSVV